MSRLLLQHLQSKGAAGVVLLNRTVERAELLAKDFPELPVQCRPLTDLDQYLSTCSLVFTSTATDDPIIDAARLKPLNRRSRLRLIDIGVPRNIAADAAEVPGVESHDVDDLQEVVARNQEARQAMAREAEQLLNQEAQQFLDCGTASRPCRPSIDSARPWKRLQRSAGALRTGPIFAARARWRRP